MAKTTQIAMRFFSVFLCGFSLLTISFEARAQSAEEVLNYLKGLGHGSYMFGQVATWVHNENPDMDHSSNWVRKVRDHTGTLPRYGCITYDFVDDPFSDAEWNNGCKETLGPRDDRRDLQLLCESLRRRHGMTLAKSS